jgi:predicted glycosyltransferase
MRIWIDLANSPHVPFFRSVANEFIQRNHEITVTARDFAETIELARVAGFAPEVIGGHGGGKLFDKAGNLVQRAMSLARWARKQDLDLALSHNSYSQILAARVLSLKTVTLMDYEHQPANHLAFRMASRIIVPRSFPESALTRFGAPPAKVRRYSGLKEDVYLADFKIDPAFQKRLDDLGINQTEVLVTVRPPASEALYHRFENELFDQLLECLLRMPSVKVVLLPRNHSQLTTYSERAASNLVVLASPVDGANLIAYSDLVVSAGGTMNREAAVLGVPAASIFLGEWAAVDEQLVTEGRLQRISTIEDVRNLAIQKKRQTSARRPVRVAATVADLILEP